MVGCVSETVSSSFASRKCPALACSLDDPHCTKPSNYPLAICSMHNPCSAVLQQADLSTVVLYVHDCTYTCAETVATIYTGKLRSCSGTSASCAGHTLTPLQKLIAPGASLGEGSPALGALWGVQTATGQLLHFSLQVCALKLHQ